MRKDLVKRSVGRCDGPVILAFLSRIQDSSHFIGKLARMGDISVRELKRSSTRPSSEQEASAVDREQYLGYLERAAKAYPRGGNIWL